MNRMILAAIGLLAPMALLAVPANSQAVRNYDCTKAGNANKTECKSAAAAAAKPAPKASTSRNYDCSKAGNANKAVCKSAAAAAKPTTVSATTSTAMTTRHYDCTKTGNANKAACKGTTPMAAPARPAAPVVKNDTTVTQRHTTITTTGQNTNAGGPNGATAKCRDGTESFSAHRSGTCSRHGGVAQFY